MDFVLVLSQEFNLKPDHVANIISLIDEGNTLPFIARYRKELTGSIDDQLLRELSDRLTYLRNLEKRREEIIHSIEEQGKMTDELLAEINAAVTQASLEDLYRPYRPKRRTRATIARERGLEPLAELILAQTLDEKTLFEEAEKFIDNEKEVADAESAIAGAGDIIAEDLSDNAKIRAALRAMINRSAAVTSLAAKEEDSVYSMYYEFSEPVSRIQSHRILAINRGEREDFLKVSISCENAPAIGIIFSSIAKLDCKYPNLLRSICEDAWSRLIFPSLEREVRNTLTDGANEQAISMFGLNLSQLLMQPPVKGHTVMGVDPAYRTGCKIAVVDMTGKVLDTAVIYPTPPQNKIDEAKKILEKLIAKHNVEIFSIGNGTASKETEIFISELIHELKAPLQYMVVSEAGASVYSASKLAAAEFPDFDVSLRSAVSIARRLQDPLAELVKIDPKSIGVGQYQHDMPQARLDEALGGVVEDCVNKVGVDLNTASSSLLSYVSGVSSAVAKNIVTYREENGAFKTRAELKKVPKLGPKAYEQCAGFLRIPESKNILDNTGVHPESYDAAKIILSKAKTVDELDALAKGSLSDLAEECGVGVPTLSDIIKELQKPGRDPRDELPKPLLRSDVMDLNDLKPGMELKGTVRNVIDFGAFIDIGVHQDGLVHISQICDRFIRHPSEVLKVGDIVTVWVLEVIPEKKRISLTMKKQ